MVTKCTARDKCLPTQMTHYVVNSVVDLRGGGSRLPPPSATDRRRHSTPGKWKR